MLQWLFTEYINPVALTLRASQGYRLSTSLISTTITDFFVFNDLKNFSASKSKLERVPQSFKVAIGNAVLEWNEECAVNHVKRD